VDGRARQKLLLTILAAARCAAVVHLELALRGQAIVGDGVAAIYVVVTRHTGDFIPMPLKALQIEVASDSRAAIRTSHGAHGTHRNPRASHAPNYSETRRSRETCARCSGDTWVNERTRRRPDFPFARAGGEHQSARKPG